MHTNHNNQQARMWVMPRHYNLQEAEQPLPSILYAALTRGVMAKKYATELDALPTIGLGMSNCKTQYLL